jgi:hypothetical protein
MSGDRYLSGFCRMPDLAMASTLGDLAPAILLDQTDYFSHFRRRFSA